MAQFNPFWFSEILNKVFGRKNYEKKITLNKEPMFDSFWTVCLVSYISILAVCFMVLIIIFVATSVSR